MDCHESLMQRRRKRNRAAAPTKKPAPGVKLDKSLPSLPPEEADHARLADDLLPDTYAEPVTEGSSRGAAPALDAGRLPGSSGTRAAADQGNIPFTKLRDTY